MNMDNAIIVFGVLLGSAFYLAFFWIFVKQNKKNLVYKRFFKSVESVLRENSDIDAMSNQIKSNFKRISEKNPNQKDILKNPCDLLEEMVYLMDSYSLEFFRDRFRIKIESEDRKKIIEIVEMWKSQNPYISLPAKEANILQNVKTALDNNNKELGNTSLKRLADEIEILSSNLRIQTKRNYSSYFVSLLGIVLTLFFGLLSLLSILKW